MNRQPQSQYLKKALQCIVMVMILLSFLFFGLLNGNSVMAKDYHYSGRLGAPLGYNVLYDFDENYLTDKKDKLPCVLIFVMNSA